jgi:RES domain-containing protein
LISAYRISKARYAASPLTGEGGLHCSGRWHHRGLPVIYTGESLSLASLEVFVHFGKLDDAIKLVAFRIEIPDGLVEVLAASSLPTDWDSVPAGTETADLGTQWLSSKRSAVLRVPSVVTPGEHNYLLNPLHPDAGQVKVPASNAFLYDSRMWK